MLWAAPSQALGPFPQSEHRSAPRSTLSRGREVLSYKNVWDSAGCHKGS